MELLNSYTLIREVINDSIGHRIRYAKVKHSIKKEKYSINLIEANRIVVLQRWLGGVYGTSNWCLYIFKTGENNEVLLPNVYPAVDLLLFCTGATRVKKVLLLISKIKQQQIDLDTIEHSYWLKQNSRLQTGRSLLKP